MKARSKNSRVPMTFARAAEPLPAGRFSVSHYRAIHRHLFQDVYSCAGRFRTVRLTKGRGTFCYPEHVAREMQRLFSWLKDGALPPRSQSLRVCRRCGALPCGAECHSPVPEGNGRTQLTFLALVAEHAGHPLDLDGLTPRLRLMP